MRTYVKLLLAAFAMSALLFAASGIAVALRSLGANSTALTASGRAIFTGPSGLNVRCNLTLIIVLSRSFAKGGGATAGSVTRADPVNTRTLPCSSNLGTSAEIVAALNLPWPVVYNSFGGTLPNITELLLTIQRMQLLLRTNNPFERDRLCLYRGDVPFRIKINAARELETGEALRNTETLEETLPGSGTCESEIEFGMRLGSTTRNVVSLL